MKACFITALVISLLATGLSFPRNDLEESAEEQASFRNRLMNLIRERLAEAQVCDCVLASSDLALEKLHEAHMTV